MEEMKLYLDGGWLDVPHVAEVADRNNVSFIAIIGKRQIGKTYGVLKYMLDYDKRFISAFCYGRNGNVKEERRQPV